MNIQLWGDIKDQFDNAAIILGNGASIAFDTFDNPRFNYLSLFEEAKKKQLITPEAEQIFCQFSTTDFEQVLLKLWQASQINEILNVKSNEVDKAYVHIQSALIRVVQHIHGSFSEWRTQQEEFSAKIANAAKFLKDFRTIISLNYDCLLYWIILKGNDEEHGNWFKDTFTSNGESHSDWSELRNPRNAKGTSLVLYPHGCLCLAINQNSTVIKLSLPKNLTTDLISHIANEWQKKSVVPLFVCEGLTDHKLMRIKSNPYLARVYNELSCLNSYGKQVVIYGWDMSGQDIHILKAIKRNNIEKIAISIFNKDESFYSRVSKLLLQYFPKLNESQIFFFDATSPSCWIYNAT